MNVLIKFSVSQNMLIGNLCFFFSCSSCRYRSVGSILMGNRRALKFKVLVHGKKWPLKTLWRKAAKRNLYVNRGWPMFLKDNKSKETDVCGFELINNKDSVLKLSIFRAVKDPGPQIFKLTE